ncbi:MAG: anion permease, partial [Parvibaculum sp.]
METETTEAERVSYNPKAILGGLAVFAAMLMLPAPEGLSPEGWRLAALVALMAIWWVTEAIPVYATGLVPLAGFPLLGIASIGAAAAP